MTGVDGDPDVLARARAKARAGGAAVEFLEAMADSLPFPDGSFDRVLSTLFFHHLNWRQKSLTVRELRRVLAPGGELHVADWGKPRNIGMRVLFLAIQALDGFGSTRDNVDGRLTELFEHAGFHGIETTREFSTMFGTLALMRGRAPRD